MVSIMLGSGNPQDYLFEVLLHFSGLLKKEHWVW
jgi:hypothetical protein